MMRTSTGPDERVFYTASIGQRPDYPALAGRHDVDTVIVGGGFAGLNTALSLAESGSSDVMLLEADGLGHGASGRNGGFVFAGYSLGEKALLQKLGSQHAKRLYQRSVDAVDCIRRRIAEYQIDCECIDQGVIWANWFKDPRILQRRQKLLAEHYDVHWAWLPQDELRQQLHTQRYSDGLFEPNAMHIQPLKYVLGLAAAAAGKGVAIHENSRVTAIERDGASWRVDSAQGSVRCRHVVLACGGYLSGLVYKVDRAVMPIATYAMATEPLGERVHDVISTRAAVYDTRFAFDYYRVLADSRLLWGGRISIRDRQPQDVQRLLRRDLARVYPQLADVRISHAWSGLMSYARHQMPQVGTRGDGLYWAQAFGGHGLAPTTAAGKAVAQAVLGDASGINDFAPFGLVESFRPFGLLAAQINYTWLQALDWGRSRSS
ncbi:MAG: FAD-binding oxidoreductase [Rhodanobacteraceae bacterium]